MKSSSIAQNVRIRNMKLAQIASMIIMQRPGLLMVLALLSMEAGCTTMKYTHGVPNLVQVENGVWRGGQPTQEGWNYLKNNLGVTRVVKLNLGEDAGAELAGMQVIYVPIPFWQMMLGPNPAQINRATRSITNGTFVHCTHGHDRTGLVIGEYRVQVNGWPKRTAYQEMLDRNFHRSLLGLWWFWTVGDGTKPGSQQAAATGKMPSDFGQEARRLHRSD